MANLGFIPDDLLYDHDSKSPYFRGQSWPNPIQLPDNLVETSTMNMATAHNLHLGLRQMTTPENPMMEVWMMQQQLQMQQEIQFQQEMERQNQIQLHQRQQQQRQQRQQQHHPQIHIPQQHQQFHQHSHSNDFQIPFDATNNLQFDTTFQPQYNVMPMAEPTMTPPLLNQTYLSTLDPTAYDCSQLQHDLITSVQTDMGPANSPFIQLSSTPGSHPEILSQSSPPEGWELVDHRQYLLESPHSFVNPRTVDNNRPASVSDLSYSDLDIQHYNEIMGTEMYGNLSNSPTTSGSEYDWPYPNHGHSHTLSSDSCNHTHHNPQVRPKPITTTSSSSPVRSPSSLTSSGSPDSRKATKGSPVSGSISPAKVTKRSTHSGKPQEKKVGRRKGPLSIEQKERAKEIRALGACLRCKFLKKTCDRGEPCAGCRPSHARLWQVPCTRIDIKDIGYFLKDVKFDYERHHTLGVSLINIKGWSEDEKTLNITHGYGVQVPIRAREIYLRDENCLDMDWVEASGSPNGYAITTAKMSTGGDAVSTTMLSDYLDRHIDGTNNTFEKFVDKYFEGTPFLSPMLKTAYRFYFRTGSSTIKKALKMILAYCLTMHITLVENAPTDESFVGKIEEETSKFFGKTAAPVMVNFEIKYYMGKMWRELHKEVLEELSSLYTSVYTGDKLKNWPTIFILASILLAVWECMQFDCLYRVPDNVAVEKFCNDMESTPVGVVVGLFQAISQKLPAFLEWDTNKHSALLGSNQVVCDTLTEVREHVSQHESYLRERPQAKFDRKDFDCLSNKFLSKLVIRAN